MRTFCTRCMRLGCPSGIGHYKFTAGLWLNRIRRQYGLKAWLRHWTRLDYSKIEDVEVDGINTRDYPDFCDAFISSATYKGREMSDAELERLNEDGDFVHGAVYEHLF
jgi:hypothetical protein